MKVTFKTLTDAVKAAGGEANVIAIVARHLNMKSREEGKRAVVKAAIAKAGGLDKLLESLKQ